MKKRIPSTTFDVTGNHEGWERFPDSEVAAPPGYELIVAWRKGNELRIHVEPMVHLERCPVCGSRVTLHDYEEPEAKDWNHGDYAATMALVQIARASGLQ